MPRGLRPVQGGEPRSVTTAEPHPIQKADTPVARPRPPRYVPSGWVRFINVVFAIFAIPGLLVLASGTIAAWWVVIGLLPLVCAYVATLFHTRRMMAEREINMAFIGPHDHLPSMPEDPFSDGLEQHVGRRGPARAGSRR